MKAAITNKKPPDRAMHLRRNVIGAAVRSASDST
jgi:hypothetical protein